MKLEYFSDTDSLYIEFSSRPSSTSQEIADGVVLDFDEDGNVIGIDIDQASKKLELSQIILSNIPSQNKLVA